ncbi:MAG: VWA domain-containing protein [Balneolales bacterium]|nr:VWA domain-containing protein [Balneolales bacterium]
MITGFESDYTILLVAAAILFSAFIGWWTYSGNKRLSGTTRWLVTSLRTLALIILFFLLFNPVFEFSDSRTIRNNIAILIDNTRSVTIEKGSWQGEQSMRELLANMDLTDTSATRYHLFGFDGTLYEMQQQEEFRFDGSVTDINNAINQLSQQSTGFDAVVLVTDGIFNRGLDPSRSAERLGAPFFTVAVGDTSRVRDVLVRDVIYNPNAFVNSSADIEAEIVNEGFANRSIEVQLIREGQIEEVKTIQTTEERSVHNVSFSVNFTEEGTESFRVQIPELEDEWNVANNRFSFSIDVQDVQLRIIHVAFEIHPDAGVLRNLLATDEGIIPGFRNWIGGSNFTGGEPLTIAAADTLDLLILHGFPHQTTPESVRQEIAEIALQTNVMLLSLPGTDIEALERLLQNSTPMRKTAQSPVGSVLPLINRQEQDHPIFDFDRDSALRGPELRGPARNISSASTARELLRTQFRNDDTGSSMLSVQQMGNTRISQVSSWQWHRWQQSPDESNRSYYRNLFDNIIKWTAAGVTDGLLNFSPTRNSFNEGEPITFRAIVQTETGLPDNEARVSVEITGDDTETGNLLMRNLGNGRFSLESRALPPGSYQYRATAFRGTTEIEQVTGSFTVNESIIEFLDTIRRDALLQFIAENTEGRFFTHEEISDLKPEFRNRGLLERRTEFFTTTKRAHHSPWWFLLVILLVSAEWGVRKWHDMA